MEGSPPANYTPKSTNSSNGKCAPFEDGSLVSPELKTGGFLASYVDLP